MHIGLTSREGTRSLNRSLNHPTLPTQPTQPTLPHHLKLTMPLINKIDFRLRDSATRTSTFAPNCVNCKPPSLHRRRDRPKPALVLPSLFSPFAYWLVF